MSSRAQLTVACYHIKEVMSPFDDYARRVSEVKDAADDERERKGRGLAGTNGLGQSIPVTSGTH